MKKSFFIVMAIMGMAQFTQAQEQHKFRAGLDLGYAVPDGGGGILGAIEFKYNIMDNMNIGILFESAVLAKNITTDAASLELETELGSNASYAATFDYYFNNGGSSFAPFIGGGMGYNALANLELDFLGETTEAEVDGKFGGLVRAGFELGKLRLAATYHLIGKSEIGESEVSNSYFGLSLGFYVGGGKWRK